MIENILGPTDHDHLGKLLTYSAGREAKAAIIVAIEFREEHKKVLEWLNELSGEEHLFFGVKAGVIRIADSPPAPILDPVVQPNEWEKQDDWRVSALDGQVLFLLQLHSAPHPFGDREDQPRR